MDLFCTYYLTTSQLLLRYYKPINESQKLLLGKKKHKSCSHRVGRENHKKKGKRSILDE